MIDTVLDWVTAHRLNEVSDVIGRAHELSRLDDTSHLTSHPLSRISRTEIAALIRDLEKLDRVDATEEQVKARLKRLFQGHLLENTPAGREFLKRNIRKNLAIRSYLARELTQIVPRGERFKVSAQIAELLMDSKRIDGVLYPCMAGDVAKYGGAVNMAIKPESADRLFVPDTCWVSRVEEYSEAGFHMRCEARAKSIGRSGDIEW